MKLGTLLLGGCVLVACGVACGCDRHVFTDYRPLDQAGMWSSGLEQLKSLHVSDTEVAQLVKAKQVNMSDDGCVALVKAAHDKQHPFISGDAVVSLANAGYSEEQILEVAKADELDFLSGDLVALRLISLRDSTLEFILHRRLARKPTLSSYSIAQLKNVGVSELQIIQHINDGMTDAQAEAEVKKRQSAQNRAGSGFVRVHGRRPR